MPKRTIQLRQTKVGDAKDLKNNRNYNKTTIERQGQRFKAYKANIIRVIKHLALIGRQRSIKLRLNTVDNRSNIRSGFEMAIRT
jgi:hypothetical protein